MRFFKTFIAFTAIILISSFFANAQLKPKSINPQFGINSIKVKLLFQLERTPCYGRCPDDKISIYSNGRIIYTGRRFTSRLGTYQSYISSDSLNDIRKQFLSRNFCAFDSEYTAGVTDLPSNCISAICAGSIKRVMDYYNAPEDLRKLEATLIRYINTKRWRKLSNKTE